MTESEAKEKWCPMSFNREDCIACKGSTCMAWVTTDIEMEATGRKIAVEVPPGQFQSKDETKEIIHGYCGVVKRD